MRVALSGTPGTGKTAVAQVLQNRGYTIVHLHAYAKQHHCIAGLDRKRCSELVDLGKLDKAIQKDFPADVLVFFEGHIGHLLRTMQKVILLRCHPAELERRLLKKKWSERKRNENIAAETLDIILCEAVEQHPVDDIFEIDTTKTHVDEVAARIMMLVKKDFQPTKAYRAGQIDWSEEILHRDLS